MVGGYNVQLQSKITATDHKQFSTGQMAVNPLRAAPYLNAS